MERKEQEKQLCECLLMEAKCAHERLGAYSDATQRFMTVLLTVTTAATGYLFSQTKNGTLVELLKAEPLPYELTLLSIFISLALAQTTHYNSLAFFYIERKIFTGQRLERLIGLVGNPLNTSAFLRDSLFWVPFKSSSYVYFICESLIGIVLAALAWYVRIRQNSLASLIERESWFFSTVAGIASVLAVSTCWSTITFLRSANRTIDNAKFRDAEQRDLDMTVHELELLPKPQPPLGL